MSGKLAVEWSKHLPQNKREDFERLVRNSTLVLSRIKDIVKDKEESLDLKETSVSDFDDPNWSHKQAFRNGQRASLKELNKLLDFLP